jgi:transglutaminase-like putative cysteine protease
MARLSVDLGATLAGQGHAWLEASVGDCFPLDPTAESPITHRHVVVARGRDCADVPPLKGVYQGGPARGLTVAVELTRASLDLPDRALRSRRA